MANPSTDTAGAGAVTTSAVPGVAKVLVANRGEIAVRILTACRALGIATVAVYSDPDAQSLHRRLADEAVALGGTTPAESYLDVDRIVRVARDTGADAVHPGYGFLSESAELVEAVTAAGRIFVGPSADAMHLMGSKLTARAAATAAGVPTVPGTDGPIATGADVRAFAATHGYPVAVKASFGGGGRGMRIVRHDADADDAVAAAAREAQAYFGRAEVYAERYLERPRHVEVQILGDVAGSVVAVGTRDCSVQRRHQKLLEEAPATVLGAHTADAMGQAAVALGKAVDYRGAGTLEFLVQDDEFFFLEMNTRLQVEHPVTEMVTGTDLVAAQLRIAAGEPLALATPPMSAHGHAIELRINAEDPREGRFLPTPGPVDSLAVPRRPWVRWDGGYEPGDLVPEHYDGLVGKLVVHAPDRAAAIARARVALRELEVSGLVTNAAAHDVVLDHPDFVENRHTTRWLESDPTVAARLAALAPVDPRAGLPPRRLARVGGRTYWVPSLADDDPPRFGARPPAVALQQPGPTGLSGSSDGRVVAPMQGTIISLAVEVGQDVEEGQEVCVLEAMKMENPVRAGRAGRLATLDVVVGQGVAPGDLLAVVEQEE